MMPLRYLNGAHLWNLVAAVFNQGSTLLANLLLANILVPDGFGRYGAIQVSFTAIASVLQLSAWMSAAHFAGKYRDTSSVELGRILYVIRAIVGVAAGVVAIVLVLFREQYATLFLSAPDAGAEIGVAAVYVAFTALNSYQIGVLVGLDALRGYAKSSVLQGTAAVAMVALGGYYWDVAGALAGLSLASVFRWVLTERLVSAALRQAGVKLCGNDLLHALSELMRFSIPASINGITYMASLWFIVTFILRQPNGLLLAALYVVCMNIKTLVLFAPQQLNSVSVAQLTRYRVAAPQDYRGALLWNTSVVVAVTVFGAAVIYAGATSLLQLFGTEFVAGRGFLEVMMVAVIAEAIGYTLTQHFSSRGAMWTVFLTASLPRDAATVLGVLYFLPTHGLEAVAWVFAASWVVYSIGLSAAAFVSRRHTQQAAQAVGGP